MKKSLRIGSLLAGIVMAFGVAATPVLAGDETATPSPAAEPAALAAEEPVETAVPTATPAATETPAPTPAPSDNTAGDSTGDGNVGNQTSQDGAYVSAATVTDQAGGEIAEIVWGDRVNVILKVVDHAAYQYQVDPATISARVNSSVFTFTGNAEVGQFYEEVDPNGNHYYSYNLLFRDVIYNGGGNSFPVNLSYLDSSLPMQQFSVTLGQCVDEDPEDPANARTPNLVVRESSYGTETITAGNPFTLSLTLYATSGTEDLSDVIASLTLPDGVTMTGGSLSTYIGSMSPRSTHQVAFNIQASSGFTGGVANITVNMTGTGAVSGAAASGSTVISVPISQPDRFELGQLELTDTIYVGDSATVTLNFVNKGKNPVSNLEATISGDNLGADITQQYIGNVNAGTENSVDFDLAPTVAGPLKGTITLTYESEDGTLKTVTKDFSTNVEEMPTYNYDDPGMIDNGATTAPSTGLPVWGWVLIVAGVAVVVVVVVLVVRKRKKAKAFANLEDSDDEDL